MVIVGSWALLLQILSDFHFLEVDLLVKSLFSLAKPLYIYLLDIIRWLVPFILGHPHLLVKDFSP